MLTLSRLAARSLWNRRTTALLTLLSIAVSVTLLLGVERVRTQAKLSFANTLSGTDLIIGARTGQVQLLLYSVFRLGNATNNIRWESYERIRDLQSVRWTVPLSLGDSHRGYRVLGTSTDYFTHYQYAGDHTLRFALGKPFAGTFDAVLGAEVASKLNYQIGDEIIVAHGAGQTSFVRHDTMPFTVTGILARTGTPVDRTVHVSLEGIEAIHLGWEGGAPPRVQLGVEDVAQADLQPQAITAMLVGLTGKFQVFQVQRWVNEYRGEPLMAIMPGVALQELWGLMGVAEKALVVIAAFVVVAGLLGMLTMILSSLNERRRELAILRAVGARPLQILGLMLSEAGILSLLGALAGLLLFHLVLAVAEPFALEYYSLQLQWQPLTLYEWQLLGAVVAAGVLIGLWPSWRAYRLSLADGMTIRV